MTAKPELTEVQRAEIKLDELRQQQRTETLIDMQRARAKQSRAEAIITAEHELTAARARKSQRELDRIVFERGGPERERVALAQKITRPAWL